MTREEAILCLKGIKNYGRDTFTEKSDWQDSLDMAIKALEEKPVYFPLCADCKQKMNEIRKPHIMNEIRRAYNMDEIKKPCDKMKNQAFCGDAVSRMAILKEIPVLWNSSGDKDYCMGTLIDFVIDLSPVTPAQCIAEVRFSKEDLREICNERIVIECEHGTCKDCINHGINKEHTDIDGARYCSSFHTYTGYDFYCADFEKRGSENDSK